MEKQFFAGIDLGGTNTAIGIVDESGNVIARGSFSTSTHKETDSYIEALYEEIRRVAESAVGGIDRISAIGIGAPAINRNQEVAFCENLPWKMPVPLGRLARERFGIPVAVDNDANAATIGEMIYGVAKGLKNFICITLGTGVGSGIVSDGKLIRGHHGFGGELGHLTIRHHNARLCNCGKIGCLEAYCSATGVARTAREMLADNPDRDTLLRALDPASITSRDVYEAAIKGDALANEVFTFTGEILGEALAEFHNISDPEAFILFGGLTKSGDLLMNPLMDSYQRHLMPLWRKFETKILISPLAGADAAILGAAAMATEAYRKS